MRLIPSPMRTLAAVAAISIAAAAPAAFAQLTINLDNAVVTAQVGQDAQFTGTITNDTGSTVFLDLPQYEFDSGADAFLSGDPNDFFNNTPAFLAAGDTTPDGIIFGIDIAPDPAIVGQTFSGTFTILDDTDFVTPTPVGSVVFNVTASSAAPEPGSLALVATEVLGIGVFGLRRYAEPEWTRRITGARPG